MKYSPAVLVLCASLFVTGCTQISIAEEEQLRSTATVVAETVIAVPANGGTPVAVGATAAPTAAPTTGPTAAPTAVPQPTPNAIPPTPVPDADLKGFSLCDQVAGDPAGGRFSARVTAITTTVEAKFERLEIGLNVPASSVPPHALARCLSAADDAAPGTQPGQGYTLLVSLDGWLQDDLFRASVVSPTVALSGTTAISGANYRVKPDVGADLAISLKDLSQFRVALEQNPTRLVVEVAKTSAISGTADLLNQPNGTVSPAEPVYYLQDGDVWSFASAKATNLTNSPETETALAVNTPAQQIAFCRTEAGASADDALAASSLWTMKLDGSDPVQQAAPGRTCADPAFSPDGKTIAFTVDEGTATPPRFSIYTVPTSGGEPTRVTPANDEWSRFGPQWLDNGRLIYAANAEDSRSTLFINSSGTEEDVGAAITVGAKYSLLGKPLAAPGGTSVAVEATRADGSGATLLVLDANGVLQSEVAAGYWARPAAWSANGELYYLATDCASSVAQSYSLFVRPTQGQPRQIAYGTTLGGFGQFVATGNTLAYVAYNAAPPGPRGPVVSQAVGASGLWAFDPANGNRTKLVEAQSAIGAIAR